MRNKSEIYFSLWVGGFGEKFLTYEAKLKVGLGVGTWRPPQTYFDQIIPLQAFADVLTDTSTFTFLFNLFLSSSPPYYSAHPPDTSSKTPGQSATTGHLYNLLSSFVCV